MELHSSTNYGQGILIYEALFNMARYGEADGRIRKVAELPLAFRAIMDVARRIAERSAEITDDDLTKFRRTLHRMRREVVKRIEDLSRPPSDLSQVEARILQQQFREAYPTIQDFWKAHGVTGRGDTNSASLRYAKETSIGVTPKPDVPVDDNGMCYPKPNGGKRIIPSIYTRIRKWWMRANGVTVQVQDMNDGHLENTMKLLHESHGNVIAKSTELLGKMANHFQNQPELVQVLESVCICMQDVGVDDMYPIFNELAKEYAQRKAAPCILTAVDPAWFEDGMFDWGPNA
jgi:hypothetical protein